MRLRVSSAEIAHLYDKYKYLHYTVKNKIEINYMGNNTKTSLLILDKVIIGICWSKGSIGTIFFKMFIHKLTI